MPLAIDVFYPFEMNDTARIFLLESKSCLFFLNDSADNRAEHMHTGFIV